MSDEKCEKVEHGTQEEHSVQSSSTTDGNSEPSWNFDTSSEDKNPFSEFSEEHLNKLDEVLSSVEVRELLQQSTPELGILNMDLEGSAAGSNLTGQERAGGANQDSDPGQVADAPGDGNSEQDDGESLPESVISVVFSDHGYAINPDRAPKAKPATAGTSLLPKATPVTITMDTSEADLNVLGVSTDEIQQKSEDLLDVDLTKPASPYSISSPRKSSRAPTRNRYLDDDWITASPSRGRGRGRGALPVAIDSPTFGLRASTRISDQKQRDLAEKILQANRQAMEAEKKGDSSSSPESKSKGRGKKEEEETPPVGRGRGRKGKKGKSVGKDKSSQDESDAESEKPESDHSDKEDMDTAEKVEDVVSDSEASRKTKKTKKAGKYEQDSDYSDSDTVKTKGKTGKKKGKKGTADETSDSDVNKKKGKVKGKKKVTVDSEAESGKDGKKNKVGADNEEGDNDKDASGESGNESPVKKGQKKKIGVKGKKKLKLKNKKLNKKSDKSDSVDDSVKKEDDNDIDDENKKSPKSKSPKKLTKKEKLKKLKEAKEAKKAALLAKRKEKLKLAKNKNKLKKGKSDTETSDTSPVKKKKALKAAESGSPGKKGKMAAGDTAESPGKKKKGKVVTKGGNKRKDESEEGSSPMKKAKIEKEKKSEGKNKRDISDSEDDVPLKKIKTDLKVDAAKADAKSDTKGTKKEQNIFSNLGLNIDNTTDTKTGSPDNKVNKKAKSKDLVKTEGANEINTKNSLKTNEVKPSAKDSDKNEIKEKTSDKIDSKKTESVKDKISDVKSEKVDKVEKDRSDKDRKDSKDKHKDSKDDHSHHHHHHHHHHDHHRRHSHEQRDSVSSEERRRSTSTDKKESDSRKDSHRRDSHEKSEHSHSRRDSKDRRDSHHRRDSRDSRRESSDKDRKSSHSKDKRKHDRRDSSTLKDKSRRRDSERNESDDKKADKGKDRRDSVASNVDKSNTPSTKKVGSKDVKSKQKKAKKDDLPVDSSMIDLFKPDNMPPPAKEEPKEEPKQEVKEIRESKVKFQDEKITDKKSDILNDKQEVSVKIQVKSSSEQIEQVADKTSNINDQVTENLKDDKNQGKENEAKSTDTEITNKDETMEEGDNLKKNEIDEVETMKESDNAVELKADGTTLEEVESETKDSVELDDKNSDNVESIKKETDKANIDSLKTDKLESDKLESEINNKEENKTIVESDTKNEHDKQVTTPIETPVKPTKAPIKNRLNISDFFTEKRLKINDPKPRKVVVKEVEPDVHINVEASSAEDEQVEVQDCTVKRSRRNKAVAFAEILKKEKLGSDEEEEDDEFEDDENDEDFEDPNKLYCICRQAHNQRFMICCDQCEEWFHGKCVGITRARGQQMEENNEEYICPPCSQGKEDPEAEEDKSQIKERSSLFESLTEDGIAETVSPEKNETTANTEIDPSGKTPTKSDNSTAKDSKSSKQTTPTSKHGTPTSKDSEEKKKKSPLGQIRKKSETDLTEKRKRVIKMFKEGVSPSKDRKQGIKCLLCSRSAKPGSQYCSTECQTKHTKETVKPVSILKVTHVKKPKNEKHVAVVERSTGKTLTGDKAPTESELKDWLAKNPTFEILKSHRKPETKPASSSSDKKSDSSKSVSKSSKDERTDSKSQKLPEGPEPVRLNVRKGLRDALAARVESADDMMLSNSEIKGLALSIEEELYRYFKDTDHKYKAKYRSLIFNIKDQKNKGLFRKILSGRIRPSKLVRMSADELASKELAQWREQEAKHTIEMIKQTETELMKEQTHVTKKTHKGEIEVEEESDMSSLVEEPKKEPAQKPESKVDLLAELLPDTTDKHGQHLFDANCKICTGKLAPAVDSTPTKSTTVVKTEIVPKEEEKPEEDLTKQERDLQAEEVVKEVLKAIQRAKADAKKEELESQLMSSVTVRSPDSALSSGLDKKAKFTPSGPMLWKGFIYMQDVSKFVTTAYRVTGPADNLSMPDTITVCGRINPEHVWDYLNKVKQAASRDICVIRFIPGPSEEKAAYINLYSYLNSRSRCGVVENKAKNIKDFYIVPLASHSKIPDVLLPFDGPGLEENRCHMLLGVIIRNKSSSKKSTSLELPKSSHHHHRHHHSSSSSSTSSDTKPLKSALKDPNDSEKTSSSSTPADKSSTSSTPATPSSTSTPGEKKKSISFDPIVKEYSHVSEHEEHDPSGDDPLGLNAPYDPEKETLKPKKAAKSDPVSLMIDKIAMSKNPAEATAAMVTALATTSKLGNQKKLLLELTKKVDEQKKLLEKKRLSSKSGESPKSSTSSPKDGNSPSASKKKQRISSKDPRLQAKLKSEAETAASSPAQEPMDVDMRVKPVDPSVSGAVLGPAPNDPRLRGPASTLNITAAAGTSSTAIHSQQISIENTIKDTIEDSSIPVDPKTPTRIIPTGFYIDHNHGLSADKTEARATSADTKSVTINKPVTINTAPDVVKTGWSEVKQTEKADSVLERLKETKPVGVVSFKLAKKDSDATKGKSDDKQDTSVITGTKLGDSDSGRKVEPGFDIVSHLQAEISGKSVKVIAESEKANVKDSENVPDSSEAGQAGVQLPTALRSLFTSLPPTTGEEPAQEEVKEPDPVPQDVDMRAPISSGQVIPGFEGFNAERNQDNKVKKTKEKEKLTKSFMGFDYDSDSSDGSFEGFDDDGTKKLSPRKRKLVNKRKAAGGDVEGADIEDMQDVDLRSMPPGMGGVAEIKDVDERLALGTTEAPPADLEDVDHRRPPFPPPPGVQMPQFMDSSQPPPPGVEWEAPSMPAPPPFPPGLAPPGTDDWGSPGQGEIAQPPLPSEPPAPKPPEPPVKKSKSQDDKTKKDGNTDKNSGKNNLGPLSSDQRLKEIVLKIANKDPVDKPPYRGQRPMRHNAPMPFSGPPPMPPIPMPPMPACMPPVLPPVMPPVCSQTMPWPDLTTGIASSGWLGGPPPPPLLNTQSPMMPPILPPQLQPGVGPPPTLPKMPPPTAPSQSGPPSLLDLPLATPHIQPIVPSQQHTNKGSNSPSIVSHTEDTSHDTLPTDRRPPSPHSDQTPPSQGHSHHSRRSHEHDRDTDWRRHDRYRDRSGDSREYDRGHRSRDHRDSRERDRGSGDRDRRRKDSDRDSRRHSKSNRY